MVTQMKEEIIQEAIAKHLESYVTIDGLLNFPTFARALEQYESISNQYVIPINRYESQIIHFDKIFIG